MSDILFKLYSLLHISAKKLLGRPVYGITPNPFSASNEKYHFGTTSTQVWWQFVQNSVIPNTSHFAGFHYAGYILEKQEWCLDSWIWTNAAIVRLYAYSGILDKAKELSEHILQHQQSCGGWIVRNDFDVKGEIPMLAPNDSAYIANNAMLSIYKATGDQSYLSSALKCADWIMKTCREDHMVYTGYNMRDEIWDKNNVIVDVGFTAGLFANLYELTRDEKYKHFLAKFTTRYIELFYVSSECGFATSINKSNQPQGGMFARGQAWALEGLIPAYKILGNNSIKVVIDSTIATLIKHQNNDGSWPYNLSRKMMGNDCKAVSIIGKSILDWYEVSKSTKLIDAVKKSLEWCKKHTATSLEATGGIFSYCTEGAIVRDLYTSCAFVYASVYALEIEKQLNNERF